MPRKNNPADIRTGSGSARSNSQSPSPGSVQHIVVDGGGSHPASAIRTDSKPGVFTSSTVEGVLDEVSALVPPPPPSVGSISMRLSSVGTPDWGVLKLSDSSLAGVSADGSETYGYWHSAPDPVDDIQVPTLPVPHWRPGQDPADYVFNVHDAAYTGGGTGTAHAGAYTLHLGGPNPVVQTVCVVPSSGPTGGKPVVVSGVVYPADRGVLALIHWPARGDSSDFLAQDLVDRCPAAILLGNGAKSGRDGTPGGLFTPGDDGAGGFDPYAYPGAASGQYSLREIHTGKDDVTGNDLPAPFDPSNADPSAGQVRLGTDPNAGVSPVAGGIPILGASTFATGGGNDDNFFRYRLPVLSDYTTLWNTPASERARYFTKPRISADPLVNLTRAGQYVDMPTDYYPFQLARYRHRFLLDDTVIAPTSPREDGSYFLFHFRTERAFEALVRDGQVPSASDLYGPSLSSSDPEDVANVASASTGAPAAPGYFMAKHNIFEDPSGTTDPAVSAYFTISVDADRSMMVSGVSYFVPVDGTGTSFEIDRVFVDASDFWKSSYFTSTGGIAGDAYLGNMSPLVVGLHNFSYGMDGDDPTIVYPTVSYPTSEVKEGRVELTYQDLGSFSIANGPTALQTVSYDTQGDVISFSGDTTDPSFSDSASIRLFFRRPLSHTSLSDFSYVVRARTPDNKNILFHSARGDANALHGNFESAAGVPVASLESATKDISERFLDEVYRYRSDWGTSPFATRLVGPGTGGATTPIEVPVRAGTQNSADFSDSSWFQEEFFKSSLLLLSADELQVSGLPDISPSPDYGLRRPYPSSGILVYPQKDYSTDHRPSLADGDLSSSQPDYSSATGDRVWVRAFDLNASRSASPRNVATRDTVSIRIHGLDTTSFEYSAPGPGGDDVAVMIKVPGVTAWLDLGRKTGDGPSVDDAAQDGGGCASSAISTTDEETGLVYTEVSASVSPSEFFTSANGEAPLLVKVIIKDTMGGRALNLEQVAADGIPSSRRGIVGIEIVDAGF